MIQQVTPQAAQELIAAGTVEIVDVREPHEWAGGHLAGARHVPLDRIRRDPSGSLPRDGVLFVCAAGIRSDAAARIAVAQGLTRVYNLASGTRGWVKAGLPLAAPELLSAAG